MNPHLKENERELVKLVNFFKKRADRLMKEGKLEADYADLITSCDKLINTIELHAAKRNEVLEQREYLKNIIRDNAACPKCSSNEFLKLVGTDTHEKGWKSNKYRCRRCNIEFVWNRPNNPWDMLPFIENFIAEMQIKLVNDTTPDGVRIHSAQMIEQMQENMNKLKPVIEASDLDYEEMQTREGEMIKIIHEFKTHLLIEKVKIESMDDKPGE